MSADNGIYLLETPAVKGSKKKEYRVIHAQAIDNIYWDENCPNNNNSEGNPSQVVAYFGNTTAFNDAETAWGYAREIEKKILSDDYCPILEYGISSIKLPHPFSYYRDNALNSERD
jgi:hypothetical protein